IVPPPLAAPSRPAHTVASAPGRWRTTMLGGISVAAIALLTALVIAACAPGGASSAVSPPVAPGQTTSAPDASRSTTEGGPASAGVGAPPATPRQPVKMVYTALVGAQAIPWIGVESGAFAAEGLDVELLRVDSSGRALPVLVSGEAPLVLLTGAAVAGAAAQGSDLVMLLSCASTLAFQIMAVPEIASVEQLRGQSVGVSGLG